MSTIDSYRQRLTDSDRLAEWRPRFRRWRRQRPFWGGLVLAIAGVEIGVIPAHLAVQFAFIPGSFAFVGLFFAVFILLSGVFALVRPDLSSFFGAAGILLSIASILGALGGFVVGTLLGIVGGSLCVSWQHDRTEQ
ncbi:DUF6114 domain-containing protein [Halobacteriaceae archaeon GCM10025711]